MSASRSSGSRSCVQRDHYGALTRTATRAFSAAENDALRKQASRISLITNTLPYPQRSDAKIADTGRVLRGKPAGQFRTASACRWKAWDTPRISTSRLRHDLLLRRQVCRGSGEAVDGPQGGATPASAPRFEVAVNKKYPVHSTAGAADDYRVYDKWQKGLQTVTSWNRLFFDTE